jgi:hypothetical protein
VGCETLLPSLLLVVFVQKTPIDGLRRSVPMTKCLAMTGAVMLLLAVPAAAQIEDDGSCVFNRRIYPDGYEMCRGGTLQRCEDGAWGDVGMCNESEWQEPIESGGDEVVYPPR